MRTQSGFAIQDPYRIGISIALPVRSLDLSVQLIVPYSVT